LVKDLGLLEQHTPVLHCDNHSAIALSNNTVFHSKTKHIDVRYHFSHECLANKSLDLVKIPTSENTGDALNKSLSSHQFQHCRKLMGVR
ncbi:Ty1/Copia family ribonuclease HI, partial [Enterobacter cloacae complex sp. GF14B]|uniref:Ty1/Copia family ribonuclease HI n=1 Tax=Enterobacter cloacae complex sp. GF14B TaxID=2511982 RepID=UPI001CA4A87E